MNNQNTVGVQFKTIKLLHIALCLGVVIIMGIIHYLVKQQPPVDHALDNVVFEIAGIAIAFICMLASRFLFLTRASVAVNVPSLSEKINIYRGALIIQLALLEGPAIINTIFYFVTGNDLHFFIALGLLLFMVWSRPTRLMAANLLFNSMEDRQQIYDDNLPL
ncbi:MAG TPA: hypothetical protein PLS10_04455 [Chitinophagales bacterium]|nr:hypothetical protein [Chitinophagales bacterium]